MVGQVRLLPFNREPFLWPLHLQLLLFHFLWTLRLFFLLLVNLKPSWCPPPLQLSCSLTLKPLSWSNPIATLPLLMVAKLLEALWQWLRGWHHHFLLVNFISDWWRSEKLKFRPPPLLFYLSMDDPLYFPEFNVESETSHSSEGAKPHLLG